MNRFYGECIRYKVTFRGNTVLGIESRSDAPAFRSGVEGTIPLYQRDQYKADKAPRRTMRRFAAERVLPLQ